MSERDRCFFFLIMLVLFVRQSLSVNDGNIAEFSTLCAAYNLASTPVETTTIDKILQAADGLVNDMIVLNLSLSSDSFYDMESKELARLIGVNEESVQHYKDIINHNATGLTAEKKEKYKVIGRQTEQNRNRQASYRINHYLASARTIQTMIRNEAYETIKKAAQEHLTYSLYGNDQKKEDTQNAGKTYGDDHAAACGSGGGGAAGISLASDLVCLCAAAGRSSVTGAECNNTYFGGKTLSGSNGAESYTSHTTAAAAFAKIKLACAESRIKYPPTPANIHYLVTSFLAHLGKQGGADKPHTLGDVSSSCAGTSAADVCINYAAVCKKGGCEEGIHWVKNLLEAAREIKDLEQVEKAMNEQLSQLQMLSNLAWSSYGEPIEFHTTLSPGQAKSTSSASVPDSRNQAGSSDAELAQKIEAPNSHSRRVAIPAYFMFFGTL